MRRAPPHCGRSPVLSGCLRRWQRSAWEELTDGLHRVQGSRAGVSSGDPGMGKWPQDLTSQLKGNYFNVKYCYFFPSFLKPLK